LPFKPQDEFKEKIMRILKVASCPSISNKSILTYHIGCLGRDIYIRLFENSERGLFSKEWLLLDRVELVEDRPITSTFVQGLFKARSANTGGFMLAVLINEGLIKPIEGKARSYQCADPAAFISAIGLLIESEVSLEVTAIAEAPPKTAKKKGRKNL
jgi:hypothetical protein